MKIAGDWLSAPGVQGVLGMLAAAGYEALLVGGCVRNALLGEPVADIDIATDARPEAVIDVAAGVGLRTIPTGIAHGTVTVIAGGEPHEVTTFRRDVTTDGRRATIAHTGLIEEDAARRDFTMNALYADRMGEVVDPLGGLPDLVARRVRFVGDAGARIREDYLRILRFFRFHAWYGDPDAGLDAEALAACAAHGAETERLSRERVGHEMRRLLAAPDPAPAMAAMRAAGVLGHVLPGADTRALAPLVHLEPPEPPDWRRRLVALGGHEDPSPALRLSRAEAREIGLLRAGLADGAGPGELAYRHGEKIARDVLLLRAALTGAPLPGGAAAEIARGAAAVLPIDAADLLGGYAGKALGAELRAREARWIASGFRLSREQLLA